MKIKELYSFVEKTDVSSGNSDDQRERIATLGLVSEIGSVLSALKKDILSDAPNGNGAGSYLIRGELREEIGDAIWYAVMLAERLKDPRADDIFSSDIEMLKLQLSGRSRDDLRVQTELGEPRRTNFLKAAEGYQRKRLPSVDLYQETAFHTRRTDHDELRNVCAAVLQQLAAQLSRDFLPNMELGLNHEVRPKDPVDALGEIVWHLAALSSIYDLKLSEVVAITQEKSKFRNPQNLPGPRHKTGKKKGEHFPDQFEVHFIDDGQDRTHMHWVQGDVVLMRLGAPLTDNNHDGDGYRFHDVMHVAFVVFLGWSPNLRSFMGLKRKSKPKTDEVEDGGRAKILEEAVILEIHLQAKAFEDYLRQAGENAPGSPYAYESALSFGFLRRLRELTKGHEVYANPKQDWEDAIREGYANYHKLRNANGGIIEIDMVARQMKFRELPRTTKLDYDNPQFGSD